MLEPELEETRSRDGVESVRSYLLEAERAVKSSRLGHSGQRVEADGRVAELAGRSDGGHGEHTTEPRSAGLRPDVEALQLAGRLGERAHPDAAERLARVVHGKEEAASGRRVVPRQALELLLEGLEREVDPKRVCVLAEENARRSELRRAARLNDPQRPVNLGERFSRNAATPSAKSSLFVATV